MKFRYVNPNSVARFVSPRMGGQYSFARGMDRLLSEQPWLYSSVLEDGTQIHVRHTGEVWRFTTSIPGALDEGKPGSWVVCDGANGHRVSFHFATILRGFPQPEGGQHVVYVHRLMLANEKRFIEGPSAYVGVTKRAWHERFQEHARAAATGSQLLFHRALRLRKHGWLDTVIQGVGNHDQVMGFEEQCVAAFSLYPNGLNMIPGGFAGIRYLASLGFHARSAEERDARLADLIELPAVNGSPNPLCAARWSSDAEYVNSVICGHSGRLTVDQVRNIRMLSASGYDENRIAGQVGDSPARVRRVLANGRYQRVQ